MKLSEGKNHSAIDIGRLSNVQNVEFTHDVLGTVKGKHFIKETLGLTGMEVSLNFFPAQRSMSFHHIHQKNEELYIFVKGQGQFQVDDEIFDVKEGSLVRVAPQGVRTWRNNSNEDLYYIVIQARENTMHNGDISDGSAVDKRVEWPQASVVA